MRCAARGTAYHKGQFAGAAAEASPRPPALRSNAEKAARANEEAQAALAARTEAKRVARQAALEKEAADAKLEGACSRGLA